MTLPDPCAATPRVLGVDDFALRRGHVYGTVLVDCQTHPVLDLLPERDAATLAPWLIEHPAVEIICRDRSGAYAEGARIGAPQAVQVADRFHLGQNLGKAVERCVSRHRSCLHDPGLATQQIPEEPELVATGVVQPTGRFAERAREHHALVHDLLHRSQGIRAIACQLGWGRHTVQRYARAATWEEMVKGRRRQLPSKLDPFKPYLHRRWEAGCTNILILHREITALGYHGSYSTVRHHLRQFRVPPEPIAPVPPSVRWVTGWITRHPDALTGEEKHQLKAVLARCPELDAAAGHVRSFATMLTALTGEHLPAWIAAASTGDLPGISAFARGLETDLAAVIAGLTTQWNSGPVEGNVNRIKMLKRQMFGRAGFALLRKRVLLS
jgi:transposase